MILIVSPAYLFARFLHSKFEYLYVNVLPNGYFSAIIVLMANNVHSIPRTKRDSQRFTDNLQRHSRLLLEANKELRKATRAKSEFVSKMSHEFRAALNVVIGFTELMLDEVPGPINQQQRHSLNDIHTSSQRLLELVNEYLEHPGLEDENVIQTARVNR